jgi:hypothetical protein
MQRSHRWFFVSMSGLLMAACAPMLQDDPDRAGLHGDGDGFVAPATGSNASYIVVMADDPLFVTEGRHALDTELARSRAQELRAGHVAALQDVGAAPSQLVHDFTVALNGFSAILSEDQALALAQRQDVKHVLPDQMRYPDTDASPAFLGLTGPAGPWATGVDGEDIVVGVIDTGIWPEHPSLADDGSYSPLPPLDNSRPSCEFGNTSHNAGDVPFTCNNKLIGARQMLDTYRATIGAAPDEYDSARDDNGHGTLTAATAAGNQGVEASIYGIPRGTLAGIAPRARVIAYKALGKAGGLSSDLAAAIDQAVADGVDVISYSVSGGAGLPGVDEIALLFANDAGVFVATSASNSGPGPSTVGNPGSMPWVTTVGASTQRRFFQATASSSDGWAFAGASITPGTAELPLVDAADAGGELCVPGTLDSSKVAGNIVLCRRGAIARVDKSLAVFQAGGAGMILYNNSDTDNLFSDTHFVPAVHIDNTPGLAIKAYIAADASPTASIAAGETSEWPFGPSMGVFSSRGPNAVPGAGDLIKPDITAPGLQILAGTSPTPDPGEVQGELFQADSQTSIAAAQLAGVYALIKQANPDWSPAMAQSAVMTTANPFVIDNDRTSLADPFARGAGQVEPGQAVAKGSAFQPGLVYDAGLFEYAAFTCGADWGVFTQGSCNFLESIGIPLDPKDLNYPSIGVDEIAGSETVQRTVTSVAREEGWREYTVSVDPPGGYEVTVSPASLRLKYGQSATYQVTITNVSAPVGEWRFGSLRWNDATGLYDVASPIAVRAALPTPP